MDKRKNYAYVTVLTSINYLDGIRTLLYSLKKTKSRYPLVVLVPVGFDLSCQKAIKSWGAFIEYAENVNLGDLEKRNKRPYWNETFFKLRVFNLTQYKKIVYIDSDMVILKNLDHLFEKKHISAVQGGKLIFHWEDINSGLMVIEPNEKEFSDLMNLIPRVCESKIESDIGFGDQDIISFYYRHVNKMWEGENRLDERYNAMIRCIHELCVFFGYKNLKVIHFTGEKKPWMFSITDALKYLIYYTLHHERYRALCAFVYFKHVFWAKVKLHNPIEGVFL